MPSDDLTDKRRAFCEAYVRCRNGTDAALIAGYAPKSAASKGSTLLRDPAVREHILCLEEERRDIGPATRIVKRKLEELLLYLTQEASVCDVVEWDELCEEVTESGGRVYVRPSWALTPKQRWSLKSVRVKRTSHGLDVRVEQKDPNHVQTALNYLSLGGSGVEELCNALLAETTILDQIPEVPRLESGPE